MAIGQRQLVILRHAKSAWPDGIPDRQRPLAGVRARRDASATGLWLRDELGRLDAVLCSPAERARQTWARVAAELDNPPPATFDKRIYDAPPGALLTVVRELHPDAATALLIGHNPGVQELVLLLSGQKLTSRPPRSPYWTGRAARPTQLPEIGHLRQHVTPRE